MLSMATTAVLTRVPLVSPLCAGPPGSAGASADVARGVERAELEAQVRELRRLRLAQFDTDAASTQLQREWSESPDKYLEAVRSTSR